MAERYDRGINNRRILKPQVRKGADSIYHQYVIRCRERDALLQYLADNDIQTQIHYPVPPHLAQCYRYLGGKAGDYPITEQYADEVLSLPIYTGMTEAEQAYVIEKVNAF